MTAYYGMHIVYPAGAERAMWNHPSRWFPLSSVLSTMPTIRVVDDTCMLECVYSNLADGGRSNRRHLDPPPLRCPSVQRGR
jgi:hypothetical protein